MTQGLRDAGFEVRAAVDIDPLALQSFKLNRRGVKVWSVDIRDLSTAEVMRALALKPGELDLLAACPPCQGLSRIRTKNGSREIIDERNELIFEVLRFVKALRPRAVMLENVPELETDDRFTKFTRALRACGYSVSHQVLDAADYGVPQRRRRLIMLAGRSGTIPFAPQASARTTVRDAIAGLAKPGSSGDPLHDFPENRSPRIRRLIRAIPANGGGRRDLPSDLVLDCHRQTTGFKDVYGRMEWDGVAPTITGGCVNPSKGRFLHPIEHRSITLREAALLQSFPPAYRFALGRGKYAVAELIGNALPPRFVRAHAKEVAKYLRRINPAADSRRHADN